MRRLIDHPVQMTIVAFALAAAAVVGIGAAYGFGAFAAVWSRPQWGWLPLAVAAAPLSHAGYLLAYRAVADADGVPDVPLPLLLRLVAAGFGPFVVRGGFGMDRHALRAIHRDRRKALTRMLGLGALEWLLLAPAGCAAAIVLLAVGDHRPLPSMLWPWALAVPIGFALGIWALLPRQRRWLQSRGGRIRRAITSLASSAEILLLLGRRLKTAAAAYGGMAIYWALDIAAFYGAARFIGLRADLAELIVAYGTGYALTRRTMPLGGAGVTEALLTFALHWMGQPVAASLAVVLLYRALNFALPTVPALLVRPRVVPLMRAGEEERAATPAERRRAGAPLRAARG